MEERMRQAYIQPEVWDEETDVIIIGTGLAGLAAAIEAAGAGLSVVVLEKMSYPGGNSSIAGGGYCCWDSKLKMREHLGLGEDSWQLHYEDTLKGGAYYGDPNLVEIMVREAPAGLDWLVDLGVEFGEVLPRLGGHSAHRSYQEKGGSGRNIVNALLNRAKSLGVDIRFEADVTKIFRADGASRVLGLEVMSNGASMTFRVKNALVIASGGFARDTKMCKFYQPALSDSLGCNNHKGASGDMIRYAQSIGAATIQMSFIQLYPCASGTTGSMDRFAYDCYSGPGYGLIYVANDGKRFVNELAGRDEVSNAQLKGLTKPSWSILDSAIFEKLTAPPEILEKAIKSGRLIASDSIRGLAVSAGIDAEALEETISVHNAYIESSVDNDFGKPISPAMLPIRGETYYAISQWPTIHYCMGGLKINERAAVLDIFGDEIPGLYAAGEVTGGIHGSNRLGGNALADCVVFGRRAGKAIAGA
jgi:fumarate reductase flavoprotein subunit